VKEIDFSRAERVDKSFVTKKFRKLESDMIWKLSLQGEAVYLFLLIEFQSCVDRFMALRMLRYILEFYAGLVPGLRKDGKLPYVFPILHYNGDAPWTPPAELSELIDIRIAESFLPRFRYYKIAENEFSEHALEETRNLVSALFLVETTDPDALQGKIELIVDILKKERPEVTELFARWFVSFFHREGMELSEKMDALQEVRTMFATALKRKEQEWFRQGIEKGLEKGERKKALETAERMLAKGIDMDEIAQLTGLARDDVLALRNAAETKS
jgi:predicted transposase/invertase (TIGR01784 family)